MTAAPTALRSESLTLDEILSLTGEPAALFDAAGRLRLANDALRATLRPLAPYLAAGTPWPLFLAEAARQGALTEGLCHQLALIEERLIDGPPGARPEVTGTAGGRTWTFRLAPLSDGGFALVLAPSADPKARDEAERELEELMSKVLVACPTCLTMARIGDGHILYRSPAATELLGKGLDSRDHFARREERADFITALLPDARVDDMRITARRGDGSHFPASISARLIDYRGDDVIVSSIVDLSEALALQEELARKRDQVFQAEKMSALGELLAGVAHELNNPLSIVVGHAHMLLEDAADPAALKRLGRMTEAAERCVRIVRTFLSMARERPLELAVMPVADLVTTALDAFRVNEPATEAEVDVRIDIAPDLPDLCIDEVQIVQVLGNLMTNARQALAGRPNGRMEIAARPGPSAGLVRLRVTDNGPGVPEAIAGRIFDPLFTTKEAGKGTGIGLALCHRIVTAHGGSLALDGSRAGGASFIIDLPTAGA